MDINIPKSEQQPKLLACHGALLKFRHLVRENRVLPRHIVIIRHLHLRDVHVFNWTTTQKTPCLTTL